MKLADGPCEDYFWEDKAAEKWYRCKRRGEERRQGCCATNSIFGWGKKQCDTLKGYRHWKALRKQQKNIADQRRANTREAVDPIRKRTKAFKMKLKQVDRALALCQKSRDEIERKVGPYAGFKLERETSRAASARAASECSVPLKHHLKELLGRVEGADYEVDTACEKLYTLGDTWFPATCESYFYVVDDIMYR